MFQWRHVSGFPAFASVDTKPISSGPVLRSCRHPAIVNATDRRRALWPNPNTKARRVTLKDQRAQLDGRSAGEATSRCGRNVG
jgi:hypothetical protein